MYLPLFLTQYTLTYIFFSASPQIPLWEDAGIEPRTVESNALPIRLDLIHIFRVSILRNNITLLIVFKRCALLSLYRIFRSFKPFLLFVDFIKLLPRPLPSFSVTNFYRPTSCQFLENFFLYIHAPLSCEEYVKDVM